jgi:hypothetical protein
VDPAPKKSLLTRHALPATAVKWLRFSVGVLSLGLGVLPFVPAPNKLCWMLAVGVTEWGHLVAIFGLLTLLPGLTLSRPAKFGAAFGVIGVVLALSSIARGYALADNVRAGLDEAFGAEANVDRVPMALADILLGVPLPDIRTSTATYAAPDGHALRMDLCLPSNQDKPAPAVLMIHGGSWRSGDRTQLSRLNRYLAGRGFIVAAIDYRLAPRHTYPAALEDCRAAVPT